MAGLLAARPAASTFEIIASRLNFFILPHILGRFCGLPGGGTESTAVHVAFPPR
jgi:hypothetical protein